MQRQEGYVGRYHEMLRLERYVGFQLNVTSLRRLSDAGQDKD